jgi:predicted membrane channel-forming protein YqfA (hemolysin III family)
MKRWIPTALLALAAFAMLLYGPIPQLEHYHEFADVRTLFGLPNAADVLSNAGFALVGLWGFFALRGHRHHPGIEAAWPGYCVFLAAITLTAFGSSFYHLAPDNDRLLWDRLPIALACAGLLAAVHAETHPSRSPWVLLGLVVAGVASVLWWSFTESFGAGDLRPYLLMQGAPLLVVPLWHWIYDSPRADRVAFGVAILLYVLAKAAELDDHRIFETLGFMSGHTLKHLLAVAAAAVLTANLVRRVRGKPAPHSVDLHPRSVGIR